MNKIFKIVIRNPKFLICFNMEKSGPLYFEYMPFLLQSKCLLFKTASTSILASFCPDYILLKSSPFTNIYLKNRCVQNLLFPSLVKTTLFYVSM
jgi:hypothetical protein